MMISLDNYFGEYISVAASGYKEKQVSQVNRTFRLSQMGIEKKKGIYGFPLWKPIDSH